MGVRDLISGFPNLKSTCTTHIYSYRLVAPLWEYETLNAYFGLKGTPCSIIFYIDKFKRGEKMKKEHFEIIKSIGKGGFSKVFEGINLYIYIYINSIKDSYTLVI